MNERTNKRTNARTHAWMDGRMNKQMNELELDWIGMEWNGMEWYVWRSRGVAQMNQIDVLLSFVRFYSNIKQ